MSALVIGTFAPDFEYFISLGPHGRFGHTIRGALILTLPVALATLWIFHRFVKRPVVRLLPHGLQSRLAKHVGEFHFGGARRFLLIVASTLLGMATHLLWDSFTHVNTWLWRRWEFLREPISVPVLGAIPHYKLFQYASTVAGMAVLLVWFLYWYRDAEPARESRAPLMPRLRRIAVISCVTLVALGGAALRAYSQVGIPETFGRMKHFGVDFLITSIVLAWWQLVIYGVIASGDAAFSNG